MRSQLSQSGGNKHKTRVLLARHAGKGYVDTAHDFLDDPSSPGFGGLAHGTGAEVLHACRGSGAGSP